MMIVSSHGRLLISLLLLLFLLIAPLLKASELITVFKKGGLMPKADQSKKFVGNISLNLGKYNLDIDSLRWLRKIHFTEKKQTSMRSYTKKSVQGFRISDKTSDPYDFYYINIENAEKTLTCCLHIRNMVWILNQTMTKIFQSASISGR